MSDRYDFLIEKLAELEHKQWQHWTRYFLENLTEKYIRRWKRQVKTPYEKLSENEKRSDREWARKAYSVLHGCDVCGRRWGEIPHETEGQYYFEGGTICYTCAGKIKKVI